MGEFRLIVKRMGERVDELMKAPKASVFRIADRLFDAMVARNVRWIHTAHASANFCRGALFLFQTGTPALQPRIEGFGVCEQAPRAFS